MSFIIEWAVFYIAVMFAMATDNLFWIPTDSRFPGMKKEFAIIVLGGREFIFPKSNKSLKWCLERVKDVVTHVYDIVPALLTSFILAILL